MTGHVWRVYPVLALLPPLPHRKLSVVDLLLLRTIMEQLHLFQDIRPIPKSYPHRNLVPESGPRFANCSDHFQASDALQSCRKIYANFNSRTMSGAGFDLDDEGATAGVTRMVWGRRDSATPFGLIWARPIPWGRDVDATESKN